MALLDHRFVFESEDREICTGRQLLGHLEMVGLVDLVDLDRWMLSMEELGKLALSYVN